MEDSLVDAAALETLMDLRARPDNKGRTCAVLAGTEAMRRTMLPPEDLLQVLVEQGQSRPYWNEADRPELLVLKEAIEAAHQEMLFMQWRLLAPSLDWEARAQLFAQRNSLQGLLGDEITRMTGAVALYDRAEYEVFTDITVLALKRVVEIIAGATRLPSHAGTIKDNMLDVLFLRVQRELSHVFELYMCGEPGEPKQSAEKPPVDRELHQGLLELEGMLTQRSAGRHGARRGADHHAPSLIESGDEFTHRLQSSVKALLQRFEGSSSGWFASVTKAARACG